MGDRSRYRLYVGNVSSRLRVRFPVVRVAALFLVRPPCVLCGQTRDIEDIFGKYGELRDVLLRDGFAFVE